MTSQQWAQFLIQMGIMTKYHKTPRSSWAHAYLCRWHRNSDGFVVWDLSPYRREVQTGQI